MELVVFSDGKLQRYSFRPPKKYISTNHFGVQETWMELFKTVAVSITVCFPKFFRETKRVKTLQKRTEKCKILGNIMGKDL